MTTETTADAQRVAADPRFRTYPEWKQVYVELWEAVGSAAPYVWQEACNIHENRSEKD